jgi:hypothetical protein
MRLRGLEKEIDARVSIHFQSGPEGGMQMEVSDDSSGVQFFELCVTRETCVDLFSNLAYQPAKVVLRGLDVLGLKHLWKDFSFEAPQDLRYCNKDRNPENYQALCDLATAACPLGWTPEFSFNSQDTFSYTDPMVVKTQCFRFVPPDSQEAKDWEAEQVAKREEATKRVTRKGGRHRG